MRLNRGALKLVTGPSKLLLTLDEAKAHARIPEGDTDEDALIIGYVRSATEHFDGRDGYLGRALLTQTWDLKFDRFPGFSDEPIEVPLPPLQSVTSITYVDTAGATQTWASSEYDVDTHSEPGRILPGYNYRWPSTRDQINAVTLRFVAGYGADPADVPERIRLATAQLAAHWYQERELLAPGMVNRVPMQIEDAVANYRIFNFR